MDEWLIDEEGASDNQIIVPDADIPSNSPTINVYIFPSNDESEVLYEIEFLEDIENGSNESDAQNQYSEFIESSSVKNDESIGKKTDTNLNDTSLMKADDLRRKKIQLHKRENLNQLKLKRRNYHQLKPPCASTCKKQCSTKISEAGRRKINDMFWAKTWCEQGNFIKSMTTKSIISRKTVRSNRRQYTLKYSLHNEHGEVQQVCQTFFLATLGYRKNNNSILKRIKCGKNKPTIETRGKYSRNLTYKELIKKHIESFNPTVSICSCQHSVNQRYLPKDVTIKTMYDSFYERYPTIKCSYGTYRNVAKELNISLAVLRNYECGICNKAPTNDCKGICKEEGDVTCEIEFFKNEIENNADKYNNSEGYEPSQEESQPDVIQSQNNYIETRSSKKASVGLINMPLTKVDNPRRSKKMSKIDYQLESKRKNDHQLLSVSSCNKTLSSKISNVGHRKIDDSLIAQKILRSNTKLTSTSLIKTDDLKSRKIQLPKSEERNQLKIKRRNDHQLKPACASICKKKCSSKISEAGRQKINDMFWTLTWCERGDFIKKMTSKFPVSKKNVNSNKRDYTLKYSLHNEENEVQDVCQTFFLATLGYRKNNNTILRRIQCGNNMPTIEIRGKYSRNHAYKEKIRKHIKSFKPIVSQCSYKHPLNKRYYLPLGVTIQTMYNSFYKTYPTIKCSYGTFRNVLKELNISLAIFVNDECETCDKEFSNNYTSICKQKSESNSNKINRDDDCGGSTKKSQQAVAQNESNYIESMSIKKESVGEKIIVTPLTKAGNPIPRKNNSKQHNQLNTKKRNNHQLKPYIKLQKIMQ